MGTILNAFKLYSVARDVQNDYWVAYFVILFRIECEAQAIKIIFFSIITLITYSSP